MCYTKQLIRFCDATKFPRSRRHRHRLLTCWGENTHISFFRSDDWKRWLCNALFLLTNSREFVGVNSARQTKTRLFERRSDVTPPDGARHLSFGEEICCVVIGPVRFYYEKFKLSVAWAEGDQVTREEKAGASRQKPEHGVCVFLLSSHFVSRKWRRRRTKQIHNLTFVEFHGENLCHDV